MSSFAISFHPLCTPRPHLRLRLHQHNISCQSTKDSTTLCVRQDTSLLSNPCRFWYCLHWSMRCWYLRTIISSSIVSKSYRLEQLNVRRSPLQPLVHIADHQSMPHSCLYNDRRSQTLRFLQTSDECDCRLPRPDGLPVERLRGRRCLFPVKSWSPEFITTNDSLQQSRKSREVASIRSDEDVCRISLQSIGMKSILLLMMGPFDNHWPNQRIPWISRDDIYQPSTASDRGPELRDRFSTNDIKICVEIT